jgi:transcriptional regulator with XRE-family HTH domain
MPLKTDGAKIRELRERRALTLTEFAGLLGYAVNSVHMIEVGKSNGGPKFIRAAASILGCQIADITRSPQNRATPACPDNPESAARTETASPTGLRRDQATKADGEIPTHPTGHRG